MLLTGVVDLNDLAQGAIEHTTFQLRGENSTTRKRIKLALTIYRDFMQGLF